MKNPLLLAGLAVGAYFLFFHGSEDREKKTEEILKQNESATDYQTILARMALNKLPLDKFNFLYKFRMGQIKQPYSIEDRLMMEAFDRMEGAGLSM